MFFWKLLYEVSVSIRVCIAPLGDSWKEELVCVLIIFPVRGIRGMRFIRNILKPSKLGWTAMYRKHHKKDIHPKAVRKKRRATKTRESAFLEIKERIQKTKDEKKSKKAEVTKSQKSQGKTNIVRKRKVDATAMVLMSELCPFSEAKFYLGSGIRFIRSYSQDIDQEAVRKRRRNTKKPDSMSIVSATLETIHKRRAEKPELRDATREASLREIKEKIDKHKDGKKAKKAEGTKSQKSQGKNNALRKRKVEAAAMALITELCCFSGAKIYPVSGIGFIHSDSRVLLFLNSKCKRYFHNNLKPSKLCWAALYRKQHKKDIDQETVTKEPYSRAIVGATLEDIQERRAEKPEVRGVARESALREIKERSKKTKDEKRAKKAEVTKSQKSQGKGGVGKG